MLVTRHMSMTRIVTYNIQFGQGHDGKVDLSRVIHAIEGADVIVLQEVDRFWTRSHMADQVEVLINAFPGYDYAFGAGVDHQATIDLTCYTGEGRVSSW